MNKLSVAAAALIAAVFVGAGTALAQQGPSTNVNPSNPGGLPFAEPGWGPGWQWHHQFAYGGWPAHPFFFGHIFGLLIVLLLVVAIVRAIRRSLYDGWGRRPFYYGHPAGGWQQQQQQQQSSTASALAILEERFAKGEIDKTEFEDRRRSLLGR